MVHMRRGSTWEFVLGLTVLTGSCTLSTSMRKGREDWRLEREKNEARHEEEKRVR